MAARNGSRTAATPRVDEDTRRRREALAKIEKMSPDQLVQIAVQAGILDKKHQLTEPYRDSSGPSASRPKD